MGDIEKLNTANLLLVLQFVAPGFLIVYVRSIFITRRQAAFKDNVVFFIFVSVLYALLIAPLAPFFANVAVQGDYGKWLLWVAVLTVVPALIGVGSGVAVQRGWFRRMFAIFGIQPVSPYPTGWDWVFSQLSGPTYVIVTLDGGQQVAGLFGEESLAASDLSNRDIYIEEMFDLDGQVWNKREVRQGILISSKSIRYIEFIAGR